MKRILVILIIATTFFAFRTAFHKFDRYITSMFFDFNPGSNSFELSLSGELDEDGVKDFQENLLRLLDEYNLYSYQRLHVDHEVTEYIVWAYTSDPYYFDNVFLTKGRLTAINPGDYYFSNDGDQKGQIFNPVRNKNYKLYHLDDFRNEHKSIFVPYILVSYADNPEPVYNELANELKALYPDFHVDTIMHHWHGSWGFGNEELNYDDIVFAVINGMMVIICLSILIIGQSKKIQLLKLEGYGNWSIYRKYVLRYIALILAVVLIANFALFLIYIETDIHSAGKFISLLVTPNLISAVSLFALSMISFYTVMLININMAVKGQSSLNKQKTLSYMAKVLLIVFTTGTIINGFYYVKLYYSIITTEQQYLRRIEHLYHAPNILPHYLAEAVDIENFNIENAILRNEHLKEEINLFEIMLYERITINGKEILVFTASDNYMQQYISNVSYEATDNVSNIIIPENLLHLQEQILSYLNWNTFLGKMNTIAHTQFNIATVNPWIYITDGIDVHNAVVIIDDEPRVNLSGDSYFKYDGNVHEAQTYYSRVSSGFDTPPVSRIDSVTDLYIYARAFFVQNFSTLLPVFIITLLVVATNTLFIAILNCEIHSKKYAILKSEGRSTFTLIVGELKISVVLLLIAQAIIFWVMDIDPMSVLLLMGLYFALDVMLLWSITNRKMKKYSDRLR